MLIVQGYRDLSINTAQSFTKQLDASSGREALDAADIVSHLQEGAGKREVLTDWTAQLIDSFFDNLETKLADQASDKGNQNAQIDYLNFQYIDHEIVDYTRPDILAKTYEGNVLNIEASNVKMVDGDITAFEIQIDFLELRGTEIFSENKYHTSGFTGLESINLNFSIVEDDDGHQVAQLSVDHSVSIERHDAAPLLFNELVFDGFGANYMSYDMLGQSSLSLMSDGLSTAFAQPLDETMVWNQRSLVEVLFSSVTALKEDNEIQPTSLFARYFLDDDD